MQVFQKTVNRTKFYYCVIRGELLLVDICTTSCNAYELNYLTVLNYLEKNKFPMSALGSVQLVEYEHKESIKMECLRDQPDLVAKMVDSFLVWPLPKTVSPDGCVMVPDYPYPLSGTHLLNAAEAEDMIRFILSSVGGIDSAGAEDADINHAGSSVIYSASEERRTGNGYWNLIKGWSQRNEANHFIDSSFPSGFRIPESCGNDTILVPSTFRSCFSIEIPKTYNKEPNPEGTVVFNFEDVKITKDEGDVRRFLKEWSTIANSEREIIYLDDKYIVKSNKSGRDYEITDNHQPKDVNISISFDSDQLFTPLMHILIDHFRSLNNDSSTEKSRKEVNTRLDIIKHLVYALSIFKNKSANDE